jgi:hypothetical protein
MTAHTTTWRIPPLAWVPIAIAVVAEATANALKAYVLGTHLEAFTVRVLDATVSLSGAVLVLAAVAVSLSQARAIWVMLKPGLARQRIVAGVIGGLLLAVSVTAMASTVLEAQRTKVSDESGERGKYDRAKAAYDKAAAELDGLAKARTVLQVRSDMEAAKVSAKVFKLTSECNDFAGDLADLRKSCLPILELRKEMASAFRKADLETEVPNLKAEVDGLKRPEIAAAAEASVADAWGWIMGFAVVFVATFGPVIFAKVELSEVLSAELKAERLDRRQTSFPQADDDELPNVRWFAAGEPPGSPNRGGGGSRVRRYTKQEAAADLVTRLALGERFGSQNELKRRYGVAKSTMSDWLQDWEANGLIPARLQTGRRKALARA